MTHTVGPVWRGGERDEPELLGRCYRRSIEVADELGARTVAFPAISTGVYGYPVRAAAQVVVDTLQHVDSAVEVVQLVVFDRYSIRGLPGAAGLTKRDPPDRRAGESEGQVRVSVATPSRRASLCGFRMA